MNASCQPRRAQPWAAGTRRLLLASIVALGAAQAAASNLSANWRLNGNGYPGEVMLQQAADGTLSGTIYGNPLSGFHSAGDRNVVWLRGAPTQPDQAFVGSVSADGNSISGRMYGLTVSGGGVGPARNVFAFSALRAAPNHPGHPGLPAVAAGPASVAGTLALNANNYPGQLVLNQAPDGMLSGSIYGDRLSGHYAAGSGSIALLRFTGTQPTQLYIGTVTAQGISGEFYALTGGAGASAQRMRFAWTAQMPQVAQAPQGAYIGPAPSKPQSGIALLPPLPPPAPAAPAPAAPASSPAPVPAALSGWVLATAPSVSITPGTMGSTSAMCPNGKVATGAQFARNQAGPGNYMNEQAPLPDGSGVRFTLATAAILVTRRSARGVGGSAICIDRPDGYEIVTARRSLAAGERAAFDAPCPAGKVLIGGGTRSGREVYTATSAPRADGQAWQGHFRNDLRLPGAVSAEVVAVCASNRYAAARSVSSSPELQLGPQGQNQGMSLACSGRGLAVGVYSSATTVEYSASIHETSGAISIGQILNESSGIENVNARVGGRAVCGHGL